MMIKPICVSSRDIMSFPCIFTQIFPFNLPCKPVCRHITPVFGAQRNYMSNFFCWQSREGFKSRHASSLYTSPPYVASFLMWGEGKYQHSNDGKSRHEYIYIYCACKSVCHVYAYAYPLCIQTHICGYRIIYVCVCESETDTRHFPWSFSTQVGPLPLLKGNPLTPSLSHGFPVSTCWVLGL